MLEGSTSSGPPSTASVRTQAGSEVESRRWLPAIMPMLLRGHSQAMIGSKANLVALRAAGRVLVARPLAATFQVHSHPRVLIEVEHNPLNHPLHLL